MIGIAVVVIAWLTLVFLAGPVDPFATPVDPLVDMPVEVLVVAVLVLLEEVGVVDEPFVAVMPRAPVLVAAPPIRPPPGMATEPGVEVGGPAAPAAVTSAGARRGGAALTMMFPNSAGSASRPSVSSGNWNDRVRPGGGWPIRPGAAARFCARIAAATSNAVKPRPASFCGSSHTRML